MFDVIIIGGGPAGMTAALYSLRAGLKTVIVENNIYGGQVSITNTIENYPGISKITGPELSNLMYEQISSLGCEFIFEDISSVDLKSDTKSVNTNSKTIQAHCVIISNGLKRRKLGCNGEEKFTGRGVSYCATCDGSFFKNKDVIVVGGGNTAVEDALYLSNICKKITLVVRKSFLRAENHLVESLNNTENISCLMESSISEIKGDSRVSSAVISSNGRETEIDVSGIFIAIGYEPNNGIYKGQIDMDDSGYFVSDEYCSTNIPGVYVAGDCRVKPLRQIITAASDGAVSSSQAVKFLLKTKTEKQTDKV